MLPLKLPCCSHPTPDPASLLQPPCPSDRTCHTPVPLSAAGAGPCDYSVLGGEVKHREVRTMNSPAPTPVFHQFLETLLREKKYQPKSPNPSIHFIPSSLSLPPYTGPVAPLLQLCCSARQLYLGTGLVCPQPEFLTLQTTLGWGTAPWSETPCCSHSEASTREEAVLEDPALPLEYVSREG